MHSPGRVVSGDIEGFEIVVIVFNFGALFDTVAYVSEQRLDTGNGSGHRV